MNIETLKEAIGDEKFAALKGYVEDLIGQRDAARNESISGRKGKDAKIRELQDRVNAFAEKLGVEPDADLEALPEAKGTAEAAKQYESKLKRMERQLSELSKERDDAIGKHRSALQRSLVSDALNGHEFIARDVAELLVSRNLTWEGDDLLYKEDSGRLIPVKDAVSALAKSRPELLKATGAGGAGVRPAQAGGTGTVSTMTRAEFEAQPPARRVELSKAGIQLTT